METMLRQKIPVESCPPADHGGRDTLRKSLLTGEPGIYAKLADHQTAEAWFGRPVMQTLQLWTDSFNVEFKLEIPEVSLAIESLRCSVYGHFRYGHNGFGLKGEIAINARYLFGQRSSWEVLGTLLHELLHAWQQAYGKPGKGNYHNREFREKAQSLGLFIDKRGVTGYAAESPFKDVLRRYEVDVPFFEIPLPREKPVGESKLKKWSCGCTNVWCAKAELNARCLKCGSRFRWVLPEKRVGMITMGIEPEGNDET
jgi:hypothetical protein